MVEQTACPLLESAVTSPSCYNFYDFYESVAIFDWTVNSMTFYVSDWEALIRRNSVLRQRYTAIQRPCYLVNVN